mgnify:CR=1 FL=1
MKKLLIFVLTAIMVLTTASFNVLANNDILVLVNDKEVVFDVPPQIINGRTMVPMRKICEAIGADVHWNEETKQITIASIGKGVEMVVGSPKISVGHIDFKKKEYVLDEEKEIECSPCIVDGRTLVPVRALAEPLGLIVGWDEQTRTITIDYPKFQKSSDVREYIENNFYNGYYYMTERTDGLTTEQYRNTVSIISVSVSWSSPEKIYIRLNVPFADVPHEGDKAFSTAKEFMVLLYTELAPRLPKGTEIKSCEFYGYYFKYPHIHEELRTSTGCEWYTENGQMMWY